MKAKFITFEGIEGSGKTTQIKLLIEALNERKIPHVLTREPGGTPISEDIRRLLLNVDNKAMLPETELLLYSASRAQHTGELIIPSLKAGKVVICDRYFDSSIAYQGAARALDQDFISIVTRFATYNTNPDKTFLLDLPVEKSLSRIQSRELDRLEMESLDFHRKVREQYLSIAKENSYRYIVLNGLDNIRTLHGIILETVLELIGD